MYLRKFENQTNSVLFSLIQTHDLILIFKKKYFPTGQGVQK